MRVARLPEDGLTMRDQRPTAGTTPVISRPTDAGDGGAVEMTHASSVRHSPRSLAHQLSLPCPGPPVLSPAASSAARSCNSHCSTNVVRARSSSINYGISISSRAAMQYTNSWSRPTHLPYYSHLNRQFAGNTKPMC